MRRTFGGRLAAWATGVMLGAGVSCAAAGQERVEPPKPGEKRTITQGEADQEKRRLEREAFTAFERKDYAAAESALKSLVTFDAENFVPWYNLACALSMQGKTAESLTMLKQATARGFVDKRTMDSDEQLMAVRATDGYKAFAAGFDKMLEARVDARIEQALRVFASDQTRKKYTVVKDERLRLVFISAFEAKSFEEARAQIDRLSGWWERQVLGQDQRQENQKTPVDPGRPTPWVLVVLPERGDYARWAIGRFGEDSWSNVGGLYSHDSKQLVAMDLGATLRHEYWHVLHWRDMDAREAGPEAGTRGQRHPVWIMEGLCSLVEDVKVEGSGKDSRFVAMPSWRTNMVKRLSRGSGLMPWDVLMGMDQKRFIGTRPLAQYAQARAIFCFLSERGKLAEFYSAYCRGYAEDQSGKSAMEAVFGKPLKEVNREFIRWVKDLPEVVDVIGKAEANLPFDVGPGAGDGPTVDCPPEVAYLSPRLAKGLNGLKHGDVIVSIAGHEMRDLNDLARVVGGLKAGQEVEVDYRRGQQRGKARVVLVGPRS